MHSMWFGIQKLPGYSVKRTLWQIAWCWLRTSPDLVASAWCTIAYKTDLSLNTSRIKRGGLATGNLFFGRLGAIRTVWSESEIYD